MSCVTRARSLLPDTIMFIAVLAATHVISLSRLGNYRITGTFVCLQAFSKSVKRREGAAGAHVLTDSNKRSAKQQNNRPIHADKSYKLHDGDVDVD